ncbi:MAG: hypothetical protein QXS02_03330 [Candidatus Thermoplasmatota archaeon]
MTEETTLLDNYTVKYIHPAPEPVENATGWQQGTITITNKKLKLTPDNNPDKQQTIELSNIIDTEQKIKLGKLALGTAKILTITSMQGAKKQLTLISTTKDLYTMIKKALILGILNPTDVEFVSPFSKGGKILLDKQPVHGKLNIEDSTILLVSEWLGKKQTENIDITKVEDYEKNYYGTNGSITLKYIKDNVLISTLIKSEKRIVDFIDVYIKIIKGTETEEDEAINLTDQEVMLLQMIYTSDIDSKMAIEMLGVSMQELEKIVKNLVDYGLLKESGPDEVELTEKGTKYIVDSLKKNVATV